MPEKKPEPNFIAKFLGNWFEKYNEMTPRRRLIILLAIACAVGIGLWLIGSFSMFTGGEEFKSRLPSLLGGSKFPSLISGPLGNITFPSLLTRVTPQTPTFEGFICKMIYENNMMNFTAGKTTCYKDGAGYDCLCITPV